MATTITRLALLFLVSAPAVAAPPAAISDCDTLFALRVAERLGLPDCSSAPVAGGICAGLTPNDCQAALHASPDTLAPPVNTPGALLYSYLPPCADGTDTCPDTDLIHCVDGTRPILHADKARDPSGSSFIESNKWLFYVSGGGSCFGPDCYRRYRDPSSRLEMSTCHPEAVNCWINQRSHAGTRIDGPGILSPGPANPFNGYNRVRINKCAFDGFQGDAIERRVPIDRDGDGRPEQSVRRLFHQGHRVYKAALSFLAGGVVLANGVGPALPPLSGADTVILTGNSGGGKAMIMTGDLLRDHLESQVLNDPTARVRLLIDAHYLPGLENEAAFGTALGAPLTDSNGNGVLDVFDNYFTSVRGRLPDDPAVPKQVEYYSDWTYTHRRGRVRQTTVAYQGTDLSAADQSCVASHPGGTSLCLDEIHVLLNHLTTPYFIRMDLRDNVWIEGSALFGARNGILYNWPDQAFVDRVRKQTRDYLRHHRDHSELVTGSDTSGDATCASVNDLKPTCWFPGVWAPSAGGADSHTGLLSPLHFGTTTPAVELSWCQDGGTGVVENRQTMASALQLWLDGTNAIEALPFFDRTGSRRSYWIDPTAATCSSELDCGNNLDDDGDGFVDGADSDCP